MTCQYTQDTQGGKDYLLQPGNGFCGAVTFQNTGDTVTQAGHQLFAGEVVSFSAITGPTTIVIDTPYYVINPNLTNGTFQLSLTSGGSAIALDADGTGTAEELFDTLFGVRENSMSVEVEAIETTNKESSEWKEMLSGSGVRAVSISASGLWKDNRVEERVRNYLLNRRIAHWRVIQTSDLKYWEGYFMVSSFEVTGPYNDALSYSASLESSGPVTYYPAP